MRGGARPAPSRSPTRHISAADPAWPQIILLGRASCRCSCPLLSRRRHLARSTTVPAPRAALSPDQRAPHRAAASELGDHAAQIPTD
eukprot:9426335-Pyramimonas_sp.AAC.1